MDFLYSAWRAISSRVRAIARRMTARLMGAPPKTVPEQVAAAAPPITAEQERAALTQAQRVRFKLDQVQPPSNLYIDADDFLEVEVQTELTTETVQILGRVLKVDGTLQPFIYKMPVGGGAANPQTFALSEGYLLSLMIFPTLTGTQRGQLYVTAFMHRGPVVAAGPLEALLVQGYVDAVTALAWPGGYMEPSLSAQGAMVSLAVANPAAGANFTFTVPTGERLRPHAVAVTLATAAAVATRDMILQITDGTNVLFTIAPSATQLASLTVTYSFGLMLGAEVSDAAQGFVAEPLPEFYLEPGWQIKSAVQNIQAADQLSGIRLTMEQWQSA